MNFSGKLSVGGKRHCPSVAMREERDSQRDPHASPTEAIRQNRFNRAHLQKNLGKGIAFLETLWINLFTDSLKKEMS